MTYLYLCTKAPMVSSDRNFFALVASQWLAVMDTADEAHPEPGVRSFCLSVLAFHEGSLAAGVVEGVVALR